MTIIESILISVGLAMDAFAVSVCKGLSMRKMSWTKAVVIGLWFGIFQALMPTLGYFLGSNFEKLITNVDHWIAFGLLVIIGINMIREGIWGEESNGDGTGFKEMLLLAIATSIDALAIGIAYSFAYESGAAFTFTLIGVITFVLSILGVKIGNKFGSKYQKGAQIAGGLILILLGLKILLEHLGII